MIWCPINENKIDVVFKLSLSKRIIVVMLYLEYVTHIPGSCRLSNFQPFLLSSIPHKFQPNYDEIFGFECYPTKIIVFKLKNTNYVQCDLYMNGMITC